MKGLKEVNRGLKKAAGDEAGVGANADVCVR